MVAEAYISYVEHVRQTLKFSHNVLHEQRHKGIFLSVFIHKNKKVLIIRNGPIHTPQNIENREKLTKHNATNRAPPTQPSGKSLRNSPDAAPLRPHQWKVDGHRKEVEVGGAGGFRGKNWDGEEG